MLFDYDCWDFSATVRSATEIMSLRLACWTENSLVWSGVGIRTLPRRRISQITYLFIYFALVRYNTYLHIYTSDFETCTFRDGGSKETGVGCCWDFVCASALG